MKSHLGVSALLLAIALVACGSRDNSHGDAFDDIQMIPITGGDPAIVFAHSDTQLFAVDPLTAPPAFRIVGTFAFPPGDAYSHVMTDIAVDANGAITGVTQNALYRIDPTTAACTLLEPLPGMHTFVGLTFVPAGVLDPTNEVLVGGAIDGTYWRIDATTGAATMLGRFQGGWLLSGDLVSIAGAATYVTVRRSSTGTDSLATLDLATGALTIIGDTGFRSVFGLGYWRATLYGFSRSGQFITIDVRTGASQQVSMPVRQFSGAGVTTIAPITPG